MSGWIRRVFRKFGDIVRGTRGDGRVSDRIPIRSAELRRQALTHRSASEEGGATNERLEFFGDAVLGMVVSEYLYRNYPDWDEGALSRAKSAVVQEASLVQAGRALGLEEQLVVGPGEEASAGRERSSMVADAYEAVVGAVYIDGGFEAARRFVLDTIGFALKEIESGERHLVDSKSQLQELTQARWKTTPTYRVVSEHGAPHEPSFEVEVLIDGTPWGRGSGGSKKEAEQAAAAEALAKLSRRPVEGDLLR